MVALLLALLIFAGIQTYFVLKVPAAAIGVMLLCVVLHANYLFSAAPPPIAVSVGSLTVSVFDVMTVLFGIVGVLRIRQFGATRWTLVPVLTVLLLSAVGAAVWFTQFTLLKTAPAGLVDTGLASWRQPLFSFSLLLWALTLADGWSLKRLRPIYGAAALAALIQMVGTITRGIPGPVNEWIGHERLDSARVLQPQAALIILGAIWLLMLEQKIRMRYRGAAVALLLLVLLLSQSRNVWLAAAFSIPILAIMVWDVKSLVSRRGAVIATAAGSCCVLLLVVLYASVEGFRQSLHSTTDIVWRFDLWSDRLGAPRTFLEWLLGSIFGPNPSTVDMINVNDSHSLFVDAFIWTGLVGLAATISLIVVPLIVRPRPTLWPLIVPVAAGLLAFGVFYTWPSWIFVLIGAGTWQAGQAGVGRLRSFESTLPEFRRT